MYISIIFLSSWLCLITASIEYDRNSQGITSMINYTIPKTTEWVLLYRNSITHVQAGYFKDLSNLTHIILYSNYISDIDDFAFIEVPSVKFIDLNGNKLSVIHTHMFWGLPNLAELYLGSNMVHTIESGSFKQNAALINLALYGNLLETVSQCIFDSLNHPTNLHFFIFENPLSCNETLCWLKECETADNAWIILEELLGDELHEVVCFGPKNLNGQRWNTLTTQDLNCGNMTTLDPCNTTESEIDDTMAESSDDKETDMVTWTLEKQDTKIYGEVRKVKAESLIMCAMACTKIGCSGFSFNNMETNGNGSGSRKCHLQLDQSVTFKHQNGADYYTKQ